MSKDLTSMERTIKRPFGNGFGSLWGNVFTAMVSNMFIMSIPRIKSHYKVFSFSQIIWQKKCDGEVGSNCLVIVDGADFEIV